MTGDVWMLACSWQREEYEQPSLKQLPFKKEKKKLNVSSGDKDLAVTLEGSNRKLKKILKSFGGFGQSSP